MYMNMQITFKSKNNCTAPLGGGVGEEGCRSDTWGTDARSLRIGIVELLQLKSKNERKNFRESSMKVE